MDAQDRLFGEIAVRLQLLSREQVAACVKAQASEKSGKRIGEVAFALGMMSREDVDLVLSHQQRVLDRRREARETGRKSVAAVVEDNVTRRDRRTDESMPRPTVEHLKVPPVVVPPGKPRAATPAHIVVPSRVPAPPAASAPLPAPAPAPAAPPAAPAPAPAAPASAFQPLPTPRSNSMQMGATLIAQPAPAPNPVPPPAARTASDDAGAAARADTRPVEEESLAARPNSGTSSDDYDFDAPPAAAPAPAAPAVAAAPPAATNGEAKPAAKTGTLLQASGAALRTPIDRSWRNPSRPPLADPSRPKTQRPPATSSAPTGRIPLTLDEPLRNIPSRTLFGAGARSPAFSEKPAASGGRYVDTLLASAREAGASDLHLHAGSAVSIRVDGRLKALSGEAAIAAAGAERVIAEVMTDAQWEELAARGDVTFAYAADGGGGRNRVQVFRQERGLSAAFRLLPDHAAELTDLGLPARLHKLVDVPQGLLLCAGPAGSGKSTTLAALLRAIAEARAAHVVSVEQPVEIVHTVARGVFVQYESPSHVPSLADGVALALAQGAEVIALSEITDAASAHAALHAAEAGACVLATIAASSSAAAIERVLELLGEPLRARTSALLAEHLRLVTHQILLPQAIGHGRVPALELVPGTPQLAGLITEDTLDRLPELLRTRRATGMVSQEDAVAALASSGVIQTPTPPKAR